MFVWFFQIKVNIASFGVREIQKRISLSGCSRTVDIQVTRFHSCCYYQNDTHVETVNGSLSQPCICITVLLGN